MKSINNYFVAICPGRRPDDNLLKRVAEILGGDVYNVRLLLSGEMPRIIAQYQTIEPADALAKELRAVGLASIAGPTLELHRPHPGEFIAQTLQLGENEAVFHDRSGDVHKIGEYDAFLILECISPISGAEKKETRTEKKLNLPVTLLLGGIPVWRKSEFTAGDANEYERALRIYGRDNPNPLVEIRCGKFNYSSLGVKKGLSSTENFNSIVSELRHIFPSAIYDNRLKRKSGPGTFPALVPEMVEETNRLIYMFYTAAQTDNLKQ